VVLACGRRRPPRVLRRRQPLRGRAASRHRRRDRGPAAGASAGRGRGHVRGRSPDARAHRHDRHRRRIQGVPHAPRDAAGEEGSDGGRRLRDCRRRTLRGGRARCALPAPRNPRGRQRDLRRSSVAPSATCVSPSRCASGSCSESRACAGSRARSVARAAGSGPGSHACADARPRTGPRSSFIAAGSRTHGRFVGSDGFCFSVRFVGGSLGSF
jgi:hypothetical protein